MKCEYFGHWLFSYLQAMDIDYHVNISCLLYRQIYCSKFKDNHLRWIHLTTVLNMLKQPRNFYHLTFFLRTFHFLEWVKTLCKSWLSYTIGSFKVTTKRQAVAEKEDRQSLCMFVFVKENIMFLHHLEG